MKNKFWPAYFLMIVLPTVVYASYWKFDFFYFFLLKIIDRENMDYFGFYAGWSLLIIVLISIIYINKSYELSKGQKEILFITKIFWFLFLLFKLSTFLLLLLFSG